MAASFKIHEDEDVLPDLPRNKFKDLKISGKRSVLGEIQNNHKIEKSYTSKTQISYASNLTIARKDAFYTDSIQSTSFVNNFKALGPPENDRWKTNHGKIVSNKRSPLKDIKNCQKHSILKPNEKVGSPMSVDSPSIPSRKQEEEGNIDTKELLEALIQTPSISHVLSPMSVDATPLPSQSSDKIPVEDIYSDHVYSDDIYKYLQKIEEAFRPKAHYMRRQPDVSYSMRTILVDWLVEVGEEYKLQNETLFMAVSFIDRFLSSMAVAKPKLQLLGTSAMFIAAKFEEIYPPDVEEFSYITDNSYTIKQVLRMERLILKVLCFDLSSPTTYTFIMHISSSVKIPPKVLNLAKYISELTLLEADPYLEFSPSLIASGAIALARHCLDYADVWPSNLPKVTGYTLLQLGPVIHHLNETHKKSFSSNQTAIRSKYSNSKYENVSSVPFKTLILRDSLVS